MNIYDQAVALAFHLHTLTNFQMLILFFIVKGYIN